MIITCPGCATRYEVDDRRFSPDGRSVRCAECEESWFIPAPQPIEELVPLHRRRRDRVDDLAPGTRRGAGRAAGEWRDDAFEEAVEEPLFDNSARERSAGAPADAKPPPPRRSEGETLNAAKYIQETEDEPEQTAAGANARGGRGEAPHERGQFAKAEWGSGHAPRFRDHHDRDSHASSTDRDVGRAELRARRREKGATVVDADFEDVGAPWTDYINDPLTKGFGRKAREERQRATAIARTEDLEPLAEKLFNEEFFTALRVQPKELERAIRKARRRAEARWKNRLTPFRAIGWSAWFSAIAACIFVGYSYRNDIVAMFPGAKGAYDAVGIEANPYGLRIEGVTHRVAMSAEGPVIEILGRLRNDAVGEVVPPLLQAEALGADGKVLSRWTFPARADKIRAGATTDFSTRAPAPEGVSEVLLSFAPTEGVKLFVGDLLKPVRD